MSQKERQTFAAIVAENVSLIKSIARESLTQVEGVVLRSIEDGHDLETLTERLHKQFGVSERRAAMIARDQTNKATNNLSRQRLLSYGVTKGVWMHTSAGKTYRETHELDHTHGGMNGQEYDIREGCFDPNPNVSRNIQPGELVNCRCVCRPLIPMLSEEETEAGIEEILKEVGDSAIQDYSPDQPRDERGRFTSTGGNGIIQSMENENNKIESSFDVPRTLSAMAKKFYVDSPRPMSAENFRIKEGTQVTGVKAIATGEKIRDVNRLVEQYSKSNGEKTNPNDWIKARGTAILTDGITSRKAEIHWYQCENIGKVEFKRKRWINDES